MVYNHLTGAARRSSSRFPLTREKKRQEEDERSKWSINYGRSLSILTGYDKVSWNIEREERVRER